MDIKNSLLIKDLDKIEELSNSIVNEYEIASKKGVPYDSQISILGYIEDTIYQIKENLKVKSINQVIKKYNII